MSQPKDAVITLHPYFTVPDGKLDDFKAIAVDFVEATRTEPGCSHYAFSYSGNTAYCREGYDSGEALLAHLTNVDSCLQRALGVASIARVEVHGPEKEVEKVRKALEPLGAEFFILEDGFRRA
ncbi:hypothetical protein DFJ74DRAFT_687565 [Hyaloraphidium curvatum]|nr:hypothetical protein DFJ74DRAFT_687565 [Hyaloraphidium curvatum]